MEESLLSSQCGHARLLQPMKSQKAMVSAHFDLIVAIKKTERMVKTVTFNGF